jgi:hypothetical protein
MEYNWTFISIITYKENDEIIRRLKLTFEYKFQRPIYFIFVKSEE